MPDKRSRLVRPPVRWVAVVAILTALAAAPACTSRPGLPPMTGPTGDPSPAPTEARRDASDGPPKVVNAAGDASRAEITQAIRDLKTANVWAAVTPDDVDRIEIRSRDGVERVPDDKHLAEAQRVPYLVGERFAVDCLIVFFPDALRRDLVVQADGYDSGYLDSPPPSERQFWAAILAHELAHCLRWAGGEPFAEKWETRTLAALQGAGIP